MLAHYEKIAAGDARESFYCRQFDSAYFTSPWHFHPEYELTLIVEGRGQRFVGDHVAPFEAGDLVLLGSNLPHCWLNLPVNTRGGQERARSVVVQFPENLMGEGWLDHAETFRIARLLQKRARHGLQFTGTAALRFSDRLRSLPALVGFERLLALLSLLDGLARVPPEATVSLASEGFSPVLNLAQAGRLERVCRFVHKEFTRTVHQAEAASLAHLSSEAFSRFFRQKTGKTFVEYLHDIRIGEACRLLIEREDLGVTEICFRCGFGNVSSFNQHFRRRHQVGPREYRRRYSVAAVDNRSGGAAHP